MFKNEGWRERGVEGRKEQGGNEGWRELSRRRRLRKKIIGGGVKLDWFRVYLGSKHFAPATVMKLLSPFVSVADAKCDSCKTP